MSNFLKETKEAIKDSGHKATDVMFIGSADGKLRLNWNEFVKVSDFEYDSGFGAQIIAKDLIIYFKDKTYFIRSEYDGSERWEYNPPLNYTENDDYKRYKNLSIEQAEKANIDVSCGWETLSNLNGIKEL